MALPRSNWAARQGIDEAVRSLLRLRNKVDRQRMGAGSPERRRRHHWLTFGINQPKTGLSPTCQRAAFLPDTGEVQLAS